MAKKRKRQEEKKEENEYRPPEFDRREYVRTEVGISKATIIAAVFSLPMALAAVFVMPAGGFGAGILVGLAGIGILWVILPRVGIDVAPFKPMQWAGIMSTYFLVFIAVWVVLCNPPFNDFATPEIRHVQVHWEWGYTNVTVSNMGRLEAVIPANVTEITVLAQVTDNVAVDINTVMISWGEESVRMLAAHSQPPGISAPIIFQAAFAGVEQFDMFVITATDINGNAHGGFGFTIVHR